MLHGTHVRYPQIRVKCDDGVCSADEQQLIIFNLQAEAMTAQYQFFLQGLQWCQLSSSQITADDDEITATL